MPAAIASLAKELLTIEATGDRARAEAWFNRYDKMPAELAEAMKAASKLPVDVWPSLLVQSDGLKEEGRGLRHGVGRTPSSAPDPRVRLCECTRVKGRRGRRLRSGGTAPRRGHQLQRQTLDGAY